MDVTNAPVVNAVPIVPSDTTTLTRVTRGIWVGTGGHIALYLIGSTAVQTWKNVQAGTLLPVQATKVYNTNTTATDLLAIY